jgi:hypothetical protein
VSGTGPAVADGAFLAVPTLAGKATAPLFAGTRYTAEITLGFDVVVAEAFIVDSPPYVRS